MMKFKLGEKIMKKLSIGIKIALSFGIVILLLLFIGLISYQNLTRLKSEADWVSHTHDVLHNIEFVYGDLKDAETGQRGYIITGLEKYLDPYNSAIVNLEKDINYLEKLTSDNANQQQRIERLEALISEKLKELDETIKLRKSGGFDVAQELVITDVGKKVMDDIRVVLTEMIDEENELLNERSKRSDDETQTAKSGIIIIIIGAFLIVIFLSVYLTRIIARPIGVISKIANRISLGDLSQEIIINQKDEIGKLAESFKTMQKSMQEKAVQAKAISEGNLKIDINPLSDEDTMGTAFKIMVERLRSQINEITEGVNVLASSTSEIMASVTQMASSAAETATSVSETTTTVEEVKQTAEISNHKAKEISESAIKTSEISREGTKAINNTIEGMNRIKQQMGSIANMVVDLSEQSQAVGDITTTVNDLAEQSNLLAVNAAIESAKAGEQGKGFTVVAQEIKNLAERSKEATTQIGGILKDIQKSVSSAVMATEEGGKAAEEGLKLTVISGETIKTLSDSVDDASNVMIQIAASSQQQLEGMDQMVSAMENIKESSVQAAASTQQSADSVNELKKLGDKLKELMNQYELVK
ncbi:MAG: methyl-accepting chemotaxis protein [Bacteroidales bacterium]|nr:methyl-accepting chemotaxis protein [Bacteroidales bacterium]